MILTEQTTAAIADAADAVFEGAVATPASGYIRDHCHEAIRLVDVAAVVGVAPRTLQREFAAQGTSYCETLRLTRMRRAAVALGSGARPAATAKECGFATLSHFCQVFRATFGVGTRDFAFAVHFYRLVEDRRASGRLQLSDIELRDGWIAAMRPTARAPFAAAMAITTGCPLICCTARHEGDDPG